MAGEYLRYAFRLLIVFIYELFVLVLTPVAALVLLHPAAEASADRAVNTASHVLDQNQPLEDGGEVEDEEIRELNQRLSDLQAEYEAVQRENAARERRHRLATTPPDQLSPEELQELLAMIEEAESKVAMRVRQLSHESASTSGGQ